MSLLFCWHQLFCGNLAAILWHILGLGQASSVSIKESGRISKVTEKGTIWIMLVIVAKLSLAPVCWVSLILQISSTTRPPPAATRCHPPTNYPYGLVVSRPSRKLKLSIPATMDPTRRNMKPNIFLKKWRRKKSCSKLPEMARKLVENDFWNF